MALIGKIRERTGLTVGIMVLGVILFLVGRELLGLVSGTSSKKPIVGNIAGKNITLQDFQRQLENLQRNFLLHYNHTPSEAELVFIREQAWQNLLENIVYDQVYADLGITVPEDEIVDMVQGEHIHPDLKAAFTDPDTNKFDKQQLLAYLQKLAQMPAAEQAQWYNLEKALAASRCRTKFEQLMQHSIFVNGLEAQKTYALAHTTLDFQYLYIPYDGIPADQGQVTDTALKDYLKAHKQAYQVEESRDIAYVTFSVQPTEEDSMALQEELQTIKQGFVQAKDDSVFASMHTDQDPGLAYLTLTPAKLPKSLAQQKNKLKKGMVIGPIQEKGLYKLYKVAAIQDTTPQQYELAIIGKTLSPGNEAQEQVFRKADYFASMATNKWQFEKQAAQDSIQVHTAQVSKNDAHIGPLSHAREIVRWLYNEGKVGKVSPVFELANDYVVAVMTDQVKPGLAALDKVREAITQKVLHAKKAKTIQEQLSAQSELPLETLAAQYGHGAQVFTAKQVKFTQHDLQGIGVAHKAIGQAFALKPGKRSQPIEEEQGIILIDLVEEHQATIPEDLNNYKIKQQQLEQFKQAYYIPKSLKVLAHTQDFRYQYY